MEPSGHRSPSEKHVQLHPRSRRRPVNACQTCRARKVKCDERPNGCLNCERLQLNCVQPTADGTATVVEQGDQSRALTGIKRKRTFRVCIPCRQSKIRCSGERPVCSRCRQRATTCAYDAEAAEPAWVHAIPSTTTASSQDNMSSPSPPLPQNSLAPLSASLQHSDLPPSLTWLFAPELPPKPKLHSLLEAYFTNVYPLRVFAFVHKPSFMRMLEEGLLTNTPDQALLYVMCALGARFYALDYSESYSPLPPELIQNAGTQWAKTAEEMFFADYSTISTTKLQVLVLLHDHEARTGNYAGSFLLTGLIIRMAHALQLNVEYSRDILCKEEPNGPNEITLRETRRRLMWACYIVDVWAGSGVDQLTILSEKDIKLQLPCNERQFLLQIPCITECLQPGEVLDFIPKEELPERPIENMGISAYFVRIVHIWQRVLRYIKHPSRVQPPWMPNSDFSRLLEDVHNWKNNLPSWLDFSAENIYIRRASSQLGALFLVHCMYHHVLCDLHRISIPDLFKAQDPCVFPEEQLAFMAGLQNVCFENAQRISVLITAILQHGLKHMSDSILPSFVYNSSRIMLYYIARILDRSKLDAATVINRTIELVDHNNKALHDMSQLYPLAEQLYLTTQRWLDTVRAGVATGQTTAFIPPQDPSNIGAEVPATARTLPSPSRTVETISDNQFHNVPGYGPQDTATETPVLSTVGSMGSPFNPYVPSSGFPLSSAPSTEPLRIDSQSNLLVTQNASVSQTAQTDGTFYTNMENLEQPMFDLNDLQNFFEWGDGEAAPLTGIEGFGPLGWNNLSSMQ